MRKTQKRQIEETIRQMEEAHGEMKRYIEKGIVAQVEELLADCQNAAVAIGTLIENTEGEEHPAVTVLEEYCELVYQIYEYLSSDSSVNANKIYKSLRQKLIKASNSIRNDIKIRTEAVFLPYKASMWDSLESVWKAADADPDCDAYVIPIPYFDKNPDGSFKEEHYEGNQYPNYVPITRYDAFDFGKHMPDVIYIHNGYDDWNLVTSVHPDFYSRNLKNYTEELVYIPYFVLGEIDPDDEQAAEGMKHFCFMPGIINADKVIVQSENMKKVYIREYLKAAKKYGLTGKHLDRTYLEKKFLGIGSPKFDKVLNTKKEDLEIPDEWLKIIKKPDGTWKKIVFYNNSIGALLQHNEKMIAKIKFTFEIFKKNRDEIALLWRPHPLIESTLTSMRPQLWEAYREIRDQYLLEGWGIYDNSSDVDRAVVLSDAYYGDMSSVVQLCQKKGMPVMVQDVSVIEKALYEKNLNEYVKVSIEDAVIYEDAVWFITNTFNSLYSMNILTGETRLEGFFPNETYSGQRLYESMQLIAHKIYFIPFYAKTIAVFDIRKKQFSTIEFEEKRLGCKLDKALFGGSKVYGKYLFMFPEFSKVIIRLNTEIDKADYISGWDEEVRRICFNEDVYFRRQVACKGNKLMLPFCNANAVMELDCDTLEYQIYRLGTEKRGYSGICFDGEQFWLSSRTNGSLVQWNPNTNYAKIMELDQNNDVQTLYLYVGIVCCQKEIRIFPSIKREYAKTENEQIVLQEGIYTFVEDKNHMLLYFRNDIGHLVIVNKEDGSQFEIEIKVRYKDINKRRMIREAAGNVCESEILHVRNMLDMLQEE